MKLALALPMLLAPVVVGATVARTSQADVAARMGLSAVPEVHPERFPRSGARPVPMPELPTPRLVVQGLDGRPILDVMPFDAHGQPRAEAFDAISEAFRARSGEETPIDPRLVEVLLTLSQRFERPIALVSAHRIPGRGTKKTSYHTKGMAADIAIRGVKVHDLREAAVEAGATGVGVYPSFVHIDVRRDRPSYRWVGGSYGGWRGRR
ncbi:MAG: DUF882 domain-containing protein [Polyangiaceae bacterium]